MTIEGKATDKANARIRLGMVGGGDLVQALMFAACYAATVAFCQMLAAQARLSQDLADERGQHLAEMAQAMPDSLDALGEISGVGAKKLEAYGREILRMLIERRGAIIAIGSVAGSYLYPGGNVYAGSKAFANHFTLALRADLHGTGVRVTSIEPGMVETEFTLVRTGSQQASDDLYRGVNPMTGQDIADTILWIANLPPHLNINRIELMPVNQDFAGFRVARDPH